MSGQPTDIVNGAASNDQAHSTKGYAVTDKV